MNRKMPDYRAYLLRLWHIRDDGGCWRASLQDAGTRELHIFAGVDELISFLTTFTSTKIVREPGEDDAAVAHSDCGSGQCQ